MQAGGCMLLTSRPELLLPVERRMQRSQRMQRWRQPMALAELDLKLSYS
jgi:hypothetical protein